MNGEPETGMEWERGLFLESGCPAAGLLSNRPTLAELPSASRCPSFSLFLCRIVPLSLVCWSTVLLVCWSAGLHVQSLMYVPTKVLGLYGHRMGGVASQGRLGKFNIWAPKEECLFSLRSAVRGQREEPSPRTPHFSTQCLPAPLPY